MKKDMIVGFCRFSFLGIGDWFVYRDDRDTSAERLERIANYLYDEARMEARFATFQQICLPSILAQTDPDFLFIVLSSPRMPEHMRKRLIDICEPHHQVEILWSDKTDTNEALRETLLELHDISAGNLWQFRLDDDDAVDKNFISRLRGHIPRMKGIPTCGISVARGLYIVLYEGQETQYFEYEIPFHSAGTAAKLAIPGRCIFDFGHLKMRDIITNFVDFEAFGSMMLKWPSDSRPLNLENLPRRVRKMQQFEYEKKIRFNFPFLKNVDFEAFRDSPAMKQERMIDYLTPKE